MRAFRARGPGQLDRAKSDTNIPKRVFTTNKYLTNKNKRDMKKLSVQVRKSPIFKSSESVEKIKKYTIAHFHIILKDSVNTILLSGKWTGDSKKLS